MPSAEPQSSVLVIAEDMTRERKLARRLSYEATHDSLTGLVNRRAFEQRVARVVTTAREDGSMHALCYLDLDQFKIINDTCGHAAGDELLRQLTPRLQKQIRRRDTLARLGGDEFGVLLEHCSLEQASRIAWSLQQTVEEFRFAWQDRAFAVGVSVGVVPVTHASASVGDVLSCADSSCYAAKNSGRNRVYVYQPKDDQLAQQRGEMQWVSRIQQALDEDRFRIVSQRIVPIQEDAGAGDCFEILVRMVDDDGTLIAPGSFLPPAERYGLSAKIDQWVVRKTLDWLSQTPARLEDLRMCSINLSGQTLGDERFLDQVIAELERTGVPPQKLCFEITETAAISNLGGAMRLIDTLKAAGCRFALDDFGSGLSSFAYLRTLPVDILKIDGQFVRDLDRDRIQLAMVQSIVRIGQVMGMETIAEYVESASTLEEVRRIGITYAQGFQLGRPAPLPSQP